MEKYCLRESVQWIILLYNLNKKFNKNLSLLEIQFHLNQTSMRLKGIEVEKNSEDVTLEPVEGDGAGGGGNVDGGVGSPYYPVYLPMDQDFKAKYMWHHRNLAKRGKSIQELNFMILQAR